MNTRTLHHPPHIFVDNQWYMVTGTTFQKTTILRQAQFKEYFSNLLTILCNQFEISIKAWVILDNHYHILVKLKQGRSLPLFIRSLHGKSSFEFNRLDNARRRQVWQNYWDTCIHTEIDFWKRFNYIHHNPVKHGYVNNLKEWKFSSYEQYVQEKGEKWLEEILDSYPIIDFTDIPEHKD